jgi:hypothetical protein
VSAVLRMHGRSLWGRLSPVGTRTAVLLVCLCRLASASNGDGSVHADLDSSRRTYAVEVPGVITFRSGFAATIERDGQRKILSSSEGEVKDGATHPAECFAVSMNTFSKNHINSRRNIRNCLRN